MKIEPGVVLADRYVVERTLGRGGMGAVYEALDRKFGARVALKVAAATGAGHDEFKARFAREARIGHLLGRRRGVVRALDWGELPDGVRLYVAMDLVADARPLDLTSGTLDERLARLQRAAEIVADAHAQGVVHRDLKPANLLQGADGELYLTDFGLAKAAGDEAADPDGSAVTALVTQSGLGFGTPLFMAPEQFDDAKRVDARADVYALGVMLFVALTGEYPFPGATPATILLGQQRVLEGLSPAPTPAARRGDVPGALDRLCAEAIALRPEERLPAAADFVERLRAALGTPGAPVSPGEAPTRPPAPPAFASAAPSGASSAPDAPPRRRALRALAGLAAAVAAWLALVALVQRGGDAAAGVLRVVPAALVDFTDPEVTLHDLPLEGKAWSATPDVLVRGEVRDASPDLIQPVIGRTFPPTVALLPGRWAQVFEVPMRLPSPGEHVLSLWVRDRAGNETPTSVLVVHHPVTVSVEVVGPPAPRLTGHAVLRGRLSPPPPGPYRVSATGMGLILQRADGFELQVRHPGAGLEVEVVVHPPLGAPIVTTARLP
ncbi:MAG: serine/threonine protein kinase [Planctomycetes bacterium]|nr:serine/threonine protein kinase [Planctomycetota bacterium]